MYMYTPGRLKLKITIDIAYRIITLCPSTCNGNMIQCTPQKCVNTKSKLRPIILTLVFLNTFRLFVQEKKKARGKSYR